MGSGALLTENILAVRNTVTFKCWANMVQRCCNQNNQRYADYGGRGIKICQSWRASFKNFLHDMGEMRKGMTIDRIDNDGDYEPSNCRWASREEQDSNKSSNRIIEFSGERLTLTQWAKKINIKPSSLRSRLRVWSIEESLSRPIKERNDHHLS